MGNPIDDDDELAMAVGRLAGRWGAVEFAVEILFLQISEMPWRKAVITFSMFKTISTQCDFINLIARETLWIDEKTRRSIRRLLKRFSKMSETRNHLVHYPFGYNSDSPAREIYKLQRDRGGSKQHLGKPTSAREIMSFARRVSRLGTALSKLHLRLIDASRHIPPPPLPDQSPGFLSALVPQAPLAKQ